MADDIVVGSVAVDIVPDTRNFRRDLNAKLQGISVDIGVNADLSRVRADLDEVTRKRDATIVANAEVAEANAQLDEAARNRTSTIRANVDTSQVAAVGKLSGGLANIGVLGTTIITLGPALIPILAAVAGIGLALGAPLAIAGGGATVFGFLAGFAVKDTTKQLQNISKLQQKLGTLKKGTADYVATQAQLKAAQDALSPAQKKFADSLDNIKGTFSSLIAGKVGDKLLNPVTAFLTLAADVLPRLTPIIGSVSGALTDLLGDLGKAVKGPDFKAFVTAFSQQVGPDIVAFGHIAGNVFKGVAGLVVQLGNAFGPGLLRGLEGLTGKFAALGQSAGQSKALQSFVDYFDRVGPQVAQTLGAVARAVGHIVQALAPLGPPALKAVEGIADAISGIPVPVLTAMAGAFGALVLASKASKGLNGVLGLLGGGGGSLGRSGGVLGLVSKARPVPVFVVNEGFGGAGGGSGLLGKTLPGAAGAAGLTASAAAAWAALGAGVGLAAAKGYQVSHTNALLDGPLGFNTLVDHIGAGALHIGPKDNGSNVLADGLGNIPTTLGRDLDAVVVKAGKASTTLDLIGPHATNSFGQASKVVAAFNQNLQGIKDKKLRILLDDLDAVRQLEALQAYRLRNKTLTINVEQEIERAVGPGGGRGRPTGSSGGGGASISADVPRVAPSSSRSTTPSASPIHVDQMFVSDTNDALRKTDRQMRARAGGGVIFPPALVPSFGGAS